MAFSAGSVLFALHALLTPDSYPVTCSKLKGKHGGLSGLSGGLEPHKADEIAGLLAQEGFVWLDIPKRDARALRILSGTFRFHPLALQDCTQPGHMPKIHTYSDHIFLMLQVTEPADGQAREKG